MDSKLNPTGQISGPSGGGGSKHVHTTVCAHETEPPTTAPSFEEIDREVNEVIYGPVLHPAQKPADELDNDLYVILASRGIMNRADRWAVIPRLKALLATREQAARWRERQELGHKTAMSAKANIYAQVASGREIGSLGFASHRTGHFNKRNRTYTATEYEAGIAQARREELEWVRLFRPTDVDLVKRLAELKGESQ